MHVELLRSSNRDFIERSGRSLDFFLLHFFVSRQKNEEGREAFFFGSSRKMKKYYYFCPFICENTFLANCQKQYDMINAQDIKNGTCFRLDGKIYVVVEFLHVKPGKGNTFMRTKIKDVVSGAVLDRRFNIGEKLESVRVERRQYQFLYQEGDDYIFMNQETFDQHPIAHDLISGVDFLLEGMTLEVVSDASTDTVLYAEMPVKVQMEVTYTEPGLRGDTATNALKPATVESGATVRVPLFIETGETIEIDTRDGSYIGRVKV